MLRLERRIAEGNTRPKRGWRKRSRKGDFITSSVIAGILLVVALLVFKEVSTADEQGPAETGTISEKSKEPIITSKNPTPDNTVSESGTRKSKEECVQIAIGVNKYLGPIEEACRSKSADLMRCHNAIKEAQSYLVMAGSVCPESKKSADEARAALNGLWEKTYFTIKSKPFTVKFEDLKKAYGGEEHCRTAQIAKEVLMMIPEMKTLYSDDESGLKEIARIQKEIEEALSFSDKRCSEEN